MVSRRWRRVLGAAVECIHERGYYKASSNEIARRAGVTWGVIQHQFGTREGLLLAVLNDRWATMEHRMKTAEVTRNAWNGAVDDSGARRPLVAHYGQPEHLVQLQILLDLSHDPTTSADTRRAVAAHGAKLYHGRGGSRCSTTLWGRPRGIPSSVTAMRSRRASGLAAPGQSSVRLASRGHVGRHGVAFLLLVEGVAAAIRAEMASARMNLKSPSSVLDRPLGNDRARPRLPACPRVGRGSGRHCGCGRSRPTRRA